MNFLLHTQQRCLAQSVTAFRRSVFTTPPALSGHNKWSKIKEKKGANDLHKGVLYSKANRDIALAVRTGGSADPELNAALAVVIKRVKSQGVPKDNIENALKKAAGGKDGSGQSLVYEAMAPGSVGLIIECLSDNVNRTMHSIRNILSDHDARFAPVKFLFERKGLVRVALDKTPETPEKVEQLLEVMLDVGAEDFQSLDEKEGSSESNDVEIEISCQPQDLAKVTSTAMGTGICRELLSSELLYTPVEESQELDEETTQQVSELVDILEEHDDVLRVWTTQDR